MPRKLLPALLVGLGILALHNVASSLLRTELRGLPAQAPAAPAVAQQPAAPPSGPGAHLSLAGEILALEARLGAALFLPEHEELVPLKVSLVGRAPSAEAPRRLPLNIALVIDRSGSMEDEGRMQQVKRTVDRLLETLHDDDSVALVSYSTGVTVHRAGGQPLDRAALRAALASMVAAGGTNLHGGLEAGCREVEAHTRPGINRVLLFSDGLANIGVREPRQIMASLEPFLARGVTLTSIGVGADFNEDLLAEVAERGRGNYYFAEKPDEIARVLGRELEELGSVVAQSAVLRLELAPGVQVEKVHGYAHEVQGSTLVIPLKDVYAGEQRKLLVELRFAGPASPADAASPVVRPSLSFLGTDQVARQLAAPAPLTLQAAASAAEVAASADAEVAAEVLYTRNAAALEEASRLVAAGQGQEAERQLQQAISTTRVKGSRLGKSKVDRQLVELEQNLGTLRQSQAAPNGSADRKIASKRMKAQARDYTKH